MPKANSRGMLANGRKANGQQFTKALHAIYDHPDYIALPKQTRAFLWDFARQYNGRNNGDLSAAPGTMARWGWTRAELKKAKREAEGGRLDRGHALSSISTRSNAVPSNLAGGKRRASRAG